MALIMLMHRVPYVATASVGYMHDFVRKVEKAGKIEGFRLIHLHSPCPPRWRFDSSKTVEVARMAVKSGAWILWEYDGKFRITGASRKYRDKNRRLQLRDYLSVQGRFKGLTDEDLKYRG